MPLKLNVGASKKVGESNYGSKGASVNLEVEVDSNLINDPPKLQDKIRKLFNLVRSSLAEELNGNGHHQPTPSPANGSQPQQNGGASNGSSQRSNQPRPATQSQVKAIHAIAKAQRLNVTQLVRERFNVSKPEDLSIKEASQLIDSLKTKQEGG